MMQLRKESGGLGRCQEKLPEPKYRDRERKREGGRRRKDNRTCKNWYHCKIGIPEGQERAERTR